MRARDDSDPSSPGGPPAVRADASSAFAFLVAALLRRFFEQNGREPLAEERATAYARRLWQVVTETGLPRPLGEGETGAPAEMPGDRVAALAARVFDGVVPAADRPVLETPTRQLLKACLQPEFRRCRESYREQVDGVCRRQQLDRALGRISGSHCVDCPYWVALDPRAHAALLARSWVAGGPEAFERRRDVFLPESFRALRVFLRCEIRTA